MEYLGHLNIGSRQAGAFQQDDVDLLSQVAAQTAIAFDNALAYQQIAGFEGQAEQGEAVS